MLVRASKSVGSPLEMTIGDQNGRTFTIKIPEKQNEKLRDDDIFDHLDDDVKIQQYIDTAQGRR
jgi:hypothetical protein